MSDSPGFPSPGWGIPGTVRTATAAFPRNGPRSATRPRPSPAFELAVAAFEEHGIEYEAHTYPEGHGFRAPDNRIALYRRVEEFFSRHLGVCR